MPHRSEERPGRGAQRQNEGNRTETKDSTSSVAEVHEGYTPERRKSTRDERRAALLEGMGVAAPWKRLGEVLAETVDPILRDLLESGRNVNAEPGDGAAALMPDGEAVLFLATADGLLVRRNVTPDEVALFLAGAREAA